MAVLVISHNPGGTAETDEAIMRQAGLIDNPPAGVQVRAAGPVEGGWRIVSIWESREVFDTFRRERLEPAFRQLGRQVPQFEIAPLHSVRFPQQQR